MGMLLALCGVYLLGTVFERASDDVEGFAAFHAIAFVGAGIAILVLIVRGLQQ